MTALWALWRHTSSVTMTAIIAVSSMRAQPQPDKLLPIAPITPITVGCPQWGQASAAGETSPPQCLQAAMHLPQRGVDGDPPQHDPDAPQYQVGNEHTPENRAC